MSNTKSPHPKEPHPKKKVEVWVRSLGVEDAQEMHALETIVYPKDAWSKKQVEEELTSKWGTYLGAYVGEDLVGYVGAKGGVEGDIMTVAVDPTHRGMGIAGALVDRLLLRVRSRGMRKVFLEVRESNFAALRLYESHGFSRIGTVPDYYRHPVEDAVTMRLDFR